MRDRDGHNINHTWTLASSKVVLVHPLPTHDDTAINQAYEWRVFVLNKREKMNFYGGEGAGASVVSGGTVVGLGGLGAAVVGGGAVVGEGGSVTSAMATYELV